MIKYCLFQVYKINRIYSCLLLFDINQTKKDLLITTCGGISYKRDHNSFTQVISLENMQKIKNIKKTNDNNTIYAISWKNKKNGKYYIIEFCFHKISINNILKNELGFELYSKKAKMFFYFSGFIYDTNNEIETNDNDLLVTTSTNGCIEIWDLINKNLVKYLNLKESNLKKVIQWNYRYIIVVDCSNNGFLIVDLFQLKIICKVNGVYNKNILCIKKINHNKYGECLISNGFNNSINLWTTL